MSAPNPNPSEPANPETTGHASQVLEEVIAAGREMLETLPIRAAVLLSAVFGGNAYGEHQFTAQKPPVWAATLGRKVMESMLPGFQSWHDTHNDSELDGYNLARLSQLLSKGSDDKELPGFAREFAELILPLLRKQVALGAELPAEDHRRFFVGYGRGLAGSIAVLREGPLEVGSPRFTLYLVLLFFWPEVEAKQNSKALYDYLRTLVPTFDLGDLDSFQRPCRQLGLFKGRAGRPRKNRSMKG